MLKRFFREQPKATKRIKAASTRLSVEKLEDRRVFAGLLFDSVLPLGNGVNPSTIRATEIDVQGNRFVTGSFEGTVDFAPNQSLVGDMDILSSLGSGTDAFVAKYDSAGSLLWARRMGSPDSTTSGDPYIDNQSFYTESGVSLSVDEAGNAFVAGFFEGTADIGGQALTSAGLNDVFLLKLSPSGTFDWATRLGTSTTDFLSTESVALGVGDGVYLSTRAAGLSQQLFRYDADDGAVVWQKTLETPLGIAQLATDEAGSLYVTSSFKTSFDVDPGSGVNIISATGNGILPSVASTFLLKLNGQGEFVWAQTIQSIPTPSAYNVPRSFAIDNDGSILIAGNYSGLVDFDPSVTGFSQLPINDGSQPLLSNKFLLKLNSDGGYLWARAFESSDPGYVYQEMELDNANNVYLAGRFKGTIDLDPTETTALFTSANALSASLDDSYAVSLTSEGQFRWATRLGNTGADVTVSGIEVSSTNQVSLYGNFHGGVDFDPNSGTQVLSSAASSGMLLTLNATPGVTVSRTKGLVTSEAGRTASVEVSLDSAPTADVTLSVASTDLSEGSLSVSSLTFTSTNWNVPQVVRVTGVNDLLLDGDIAYTISFSPAMSTDPRYNGMQAASLSVTNLDDDVLPTKFYVVNDASQNLTYEYNANGGLVESYSLNSGNTTPRGAASTVAGDKTWVVDANRKVYVYNDSGASLGSWTAGTLATNATVEGVTTNGTDVWIVDNKADRVYRYSNAAGLTAGSQNAVSSFALNSSNTNPKDIVTDGTSLWVVNDATTDRVFKYTLTGSLVGSWTIDSANQSPTGITLDPSGASQSLWIVDSGTDRVYEYANARSRSSSSQAASVTFALAAGNTNPQGIADPPPVGSMLANSNAIVASNDHEMAGTGALGVGPVPMPSFETTSSRVSANTLPRVQTVVRSTDDFMSTLGRSSKMPQAAATIAWISPVDFRESMDTDESDELETAEDDINDLIGLVANNLRN